MSDSLNALLAMLNLAEVSQSGDAAIFEGPCDDFGNEHMIGGHVMAQAIIAAGRTVAGLPGADRRLHSLHAYFLRAGDVHVPIRFAVENVRDGRSFSVRSVHAIQHDERIFTANTSFHAGSGGFDHQDEAPVVSGPDGIPTLKGRYEKARVDMSLQAPPSPAWGAIEELHVTPDVFLAPAQEPSPDQASWLRTSGPMPDDPLVNTAVLAYACDFSLLLPAVRRRRRTVGRSSTVNSSRTARSWPR